MKNGEQCTNCLPGKLSRCENSSTSSNCDDGGTGPTANDHNQSTMITTIVDGVGDSGEVTVSENDVHYNLDNDNGELSLSVNSSMDQCVPELPPQSFYGVNWMVTPFVTLLPAAMMKSFIGERTYSSFHPVK